MTTRFLNRAVRGTVFGLALVLGVAPAAAVAFGDRQPNDPAAAPNLFTGSTGFGWDQAFVRNSAFVKRATFGRLGFDVVVSCATRRG